MLWATRVRQQRTLSVAYYTRLLEASIDSKSLSQGKLIHQHLLKNQLLYNITPPNNNNNNNVVDVNLVLEKLIHLYVACKEVKNARRMFDEIPHRPKNVLLWNLLIRAYAWNGPFNEAIDLYYKMAEFGIRPNKFTFPPLLKACSALQEIQVGKEVHVCVKRFRLGSDVYISTALVDMYTKCGCLIDAKMVFDEMTSRDVVAWNSMVAGSSLHGDYHGETIQLLVQMQKDVSPNSSTVVGVLPAVAQANALSHGKEIHGFCIRRGYNDDVMVGTGLLDMYGKCQCISYARRIFDMMGIVKNEVTWSAMIGAYVICDFMTEALELFRQLMMLKDDAIVIPSAVTLAIVLRACAKLTDLCTGRCFHCYTIKTGFISDLMVGNTLLSLYAKCGIIDDAIRFFDKMDLTDTVSFSAIIAGCVKNGNAEEALQMFHKMQSSGMDPDVSTLVSVLPACSHLAALQHGSCSHGYAMVHGFTTDTAICNALIDMYAKCGRIDAARKVFDRMHKQDIVSWNAMIFSYGIHGLGMEALSLFNNIQAEGLTPDDVTFICLLAACSHSGLVTEGKHWFNAMTQKFGIVPRMEHYICMADLLGRAGLFQEVHNFIKKMPIEPDVRVWSALLAACRVHKNIELGEEISKKIERLGPECTGNFVLLSNMYSAVGRWDDAAQVRITQRDQGFKKSPGCSWIEVSGVVHAFIGGDRSHPQMSQINNKIDELLMEMKRLGYRAESSYALHDVEEEEKEHILLYHSEKLAIAFGILSLRPSKPILVTKNLRVCGDCHNAIKFLSLITKRDITVRDASRFHHFSNGICNCGDFW